MTTDFTLAAAALRKHKVIGPRLDDIVEDLRLDVDAAVKSFAGRDVPALFTDDDWSPQTPNNWLLAALLASLTKELVGKNEKVDGDLELSETRIVRGDLHVTGNLKAKGNLFVLGNLTVDGFSLDTYMDISHIVVAGDFKCGKGVFSEGLLGVGGRVAAPIISLTFNQGFAKILGGVAARIVIESDHGSSRIFGPVDAQAVSYDELQLDDERDNAGADAIINLLAPAIRSDVEGLDGMDLSAKLIELLEAGKTIFA